MERLKNKRWEAEIRRRKEERAELLAARAGSSKKGAEEEGDGDDEGEDGDKACYGCRVREIECARPG